MHTQGTLTTPKTFSLASLNSELAKQKSATSPLKALPGMEITPEFKSALNAIKNGSPLTFITGKAGTGKTTLIHYLRTAIEKNLVVVAPTGIAALNVGGQTIHSFFQFPPRPVDLDEIKPVRNRILYEKLDVLIIDEVSMVRVDMIDAIDKFLRVNRDRPDTPFGGVQLVLVGDLFQLPPVIALEEEARMIADRFASPFFFSAQSLQQLPLASIELSRVFRQEEKDFIRLLSDIREGENLEHSVFEFNNKCINNEQSDKSTITLTCTNRRANQINARKLIEIPSPVVEFTGRTKGRFNLKGDKLPAPYELILKTGAQVMFTKNDSKHRWVNGTLGTVREFLNGYIMVEIEYNGRKNLYPVETEDWISYEYKYDPLAMKVVATEIGSYTQYPLTLAWATTIHKSQGKTLDSICVDLTGGTFAPGQTYVALSRARSISGVSLTQSLKLKDIKVDQGIKDFYRLLREFQEAA